MAEVCHTFGMDALVSNVVSGTAAGAAGRPLPLGARPGRWWPLAARLGLAVGLAALGLVAFAVDLPVASWFRQHSLPGDLARLVDFSEVFAHGLGAAVVLGVTVSLDPLLRQIGQLKAARRDVIRLCLAAYAGGLVVDVIKALVVRVRPRACDFATLDSAFDTFGVAAATMVAGSPAEGGLRKSVELMSFPSGHAAVAAGLATALAWKYPHGRWVFVGIAACAAFQRVASSAHFPSDVAWGAAIGVAAAACCLGTASPSVAEAGPPSGAAMVPTAKA
ncbi:MAG: Undecaprenyl-diphosphatase BcrC [Planctomycetota bacterium]